MKPNIILKKQKFCWHFVDVYLEMLSQISAINEDKVFREKLDDIKYYLDKKLALESDDEIIETYVVVLQQSEN